MGFDSFYLHQLYSKNYRKPLLQRYVVRILLMYDRCYTFRRPRD